MTAYLTPAVIAVRWDCSAAHVRRLCASGALAALKPGKRGWRVAEGALAAYEAAHTNAAPIEGDALPAAAQTTLTEIYSSVPPIFKGPVPWRSEVIQ